ncbi:MAG: helix-turn-helix domain-containing protein [Oscillospiraceae bacterium]|jgi:transcriptional regulator with XRE-family HTH domain|nr:helix-turn-helix domain-containing protein [Oscillospiraceae bacterium]
MTTNNWLRDKFTTEEWETQRQLSYISLQIQRYRSDNNMTQAQFAEQLGVSQGLIAKWESGRHNFTVRTLVELSLKLHIDLADLFKCKRIDESASKNFIESIKKPEVIPANSMKVVPLTILNSSSNLGGIAC